MDSFYEQIVKIKKTGKYISAFVLIWTIAVIISAVSFLLIGMPLTIIIAAAAFYGAFRLVGLLNVEYEYIITNGEIDIDKIINKASRKNVVSFSCKEVEEIAKYQSASNKNPQVKTYICTDDLAHAYVFKVSLQQTGRCDVVISPDAKTLEHLKRHLPRSVYTAAF